MPVDAYAAVTALEPVSFVYNIGDGRTRYGFIAEDTAAIAAALATHNEEGGVTGIGDRAILSVVVSALQSLIAEMTDFANTFPRRR